MFAYRIEHWDTGPEIPKSRAPSHPLVLRVLAHLAAQPQPAALCLLSSALRTETDLFSRLKQPFKRCDVRSYNSSPRLREIP